VKSRALVRGVGSFGEVENKRTRENLVGGELHGPRLERWKLGAIHRASFSVSALSNHGYPWEQQSSERVAAEQQSLPQGSDLDKDEAPYMQRKCTRYTEVWFKSVFRTLTFTALCWRAPPVQSFQARFMQGSPGSRNSGRIILAENISVRVLTKYIGRLRR
jgi:hypothetical protein